MRARRTLAAMTTAAILSMLVVAPAAAAKPAKPGDPQPPTERPLTAEEQAASDRRVAAAEAYAAAVAADGTDLVSLACVTPEAAPGDSTIIATATCPPPQGFLAVEARDQTFGHYCGPAVGQVIANYSWAMASGANKYTQGKIAGWMGTDVNGQTNAYALEAGLEAATSGAPRRPAGWDWVVTNLRDTDADGTTGDQLHAYLRSNIGASRMPMAIPVKPHDKASNFNLSSWPKPVASPGHWIAAYGWYGNWTGTDAARLYFTDSSRDEGGATGKFWNPTRHIAILIGQHTGRFVW
jgi:hypothetical protein